MKSENSSRRSSKSYHCWIAGTILIIACILFIISHIYIRWSSFPFEYRDIGSVYSGLWRRNVLFSGRLVTFNIKCTTERKPCIKLIIARHIYIRWSSFPFEYRDIGSVYSGLWRRNVLFSGRLVTFNIKCTTERKPCIKLIIARSFIFGIIGFLFGISWVIQFEKDTIGSAAICALIGSFLSLISAIYAFFSINSNTLT
ncbi:unnamed protein product [Adineta steineri]|uniref:Uncharacterized protein n=1 Tax=Adineta steineri TaxID=433720 RepID=A0A814HCT5_9BILA|nr:unnamed protein product [Adineta steineri]